MTSERKNEIITTLQTIVDTFVPTDKEPTLTYFGLVSRYNKSGQNVELIGGDWAAENIKLS